MFLYNGSVYTSVNRQCNNASDILFIPNSISDLSIRENLLKLCGFPDVNHWSRFLKLFLSRVTIILLCLSNVNKSP